MELSGGISGYVLRARASSIIQENMLDTMKLYQNNSEIKSVWDTVQDEVRSFPLSVLFSIISSVTSIAISSKFYLQIVT